MVRPPIVAILGHVDHGKSTLLQNLKKIQITDQEPGGITQSIGAYQLRLPQTITSPQSPITTITFIDTPGHEAFAKMRSRGAQVADIALLVIAADDGVKPQTLEALAHIKSARIPFVVVINKIDLPDVRPDQIKLELAKHDAAVEGYGGTVPVVEISAKKNINLNELLEMISLVYGLSLEAEPKRAADSSAPLVAPVIESRLDHQAGPLTSVIIKQGTLAVGDQIFANHTAGKVKALLDENQKRVSQVQAGEPALILGFKKIVPVGSLIRSEPEKTQVSPVSKAPKAAEKTRSTRPSGQSDASDTAGTFILKADSQGTLQALEDSLSAGEGDENIVSASIGKINESDVLLAKSTSAVIVGFRVKPSPTAARLAVTEGVSIITENVIYQLLDQLDQLKKQELAPQEKETGQAKVLKVFHLDGQDIAGCEVGKGKLAVGDRVRLLKANTQVAAAKIKQLKHRHRPITEAKAGEECGVLLEGDNLKISEGQVIIAYTVKNSAQPAE